MKDNEHMNAAGRLRFLLLISTVVSICCRFVLHCYFAAPRRFCALVLNRGESSPAVNHHLPLWPSGIVYHRRKDPLRTLALSIPLQTLREVIGGKGRR
jgi:hypothetical protein